MTTYTSIPHTSHKTKEDAEKYLLDPLKYENFKNGRVIESKLFFNIHGYWQTNVKIEHN